METEKKTRGDTMFCVGSSAGIDMMAPEDAYVSYLNSPYTGHSLRTAIDIYPNHQDWFGPVYSPVAGTISRVQKIRMGRPKEFPTEKQDYAIGISPDGRRDYLVRVLHCNPAVSVGEDVVAGEQIGSCIRSRFFNYWTGPHYHVEILSGEVFLRSTKSLPLTLPESEVVQVKDTTEQEHICTVILNRPGRLECTSSTMPIARYGPFLGHMITTSSGRLGVVDAGIPHYERGGAVLHDTLGVSEEVFLWNSRIGRTIGSASSLSLFRTNHDLRVLVNDEPALGLSLFLYPEELITRSELRVVIIPKTYGGLPQDLGPGETIMLRVEESISS
ncbi:hypothetical protein EU538_03380 [Candidatus Thorarchaeota archaeon]|nr:MAG: hypothetical protein EU538_03380 [Candidatus Thorarchaeota archaeon]